MSREFDAMVRLGLEDQISLRKAIPLFDGSPSYRTLQNYATRGLYCPTREVRVFLEVFRGAGRSMITSKQAIQRFRARINGGLE